MKNKQEDSLISVIGRPSYVRAKLIIFCLVSFWMLSVTINNIEWVRLSGKQQYGIVEHIDEQQMTEYAIVLDLDDYYVLEPIEVFGTDATINTEEYLYKEKDNLKIKQRYFDEVLIRRYSSIAEKR